MKNLDQKPVVFRYVWAGAGMGQGQGGGMCGVCTVRRYLGRVVEAEEGSAVDDDAAARDDEALVHTGLAPATLLGRLRAWDAMCAVRG